MTNEHKAALAALEALLEACPVEYDYHGNVLDKELDAALEGARSVLEQAKDGPDAEAK